MLSRKHRSVAPRPGLEPGTCGLTPISRRGVKTANESLVVLATILSRSLPLYRPARTRFFVVLAANRIAPNTHQVQALCRPRTRPGGLATPEEHWYRASSKSLLTVRWLPTAWHQSRSGSRRRRPGFDKRAEAASIQSGGSRPVNPLARCFCMDPRSSETTLHVEERLLLEHVIASARQLVRERLGGHDAVGPRLLALIEAPGFGTITARKVRG